jgi:hypothetical protein
VITRLSLTWFSFIDINNVEQAKKSMSRKKNDCAEVKFHHANTSNLKE